jgi:hypothetical protein
MTVLITGFKIKAEIVGLEGAVLWSHAVELGDPEGGEWVAEPQIIRALQETADKVIAGLAEIKTGHEADE